VPSSFDGFTFGVSERRLDGLVFGIIGSIKYLTPSGGKLMMF
jgi:hypothetical protein